MENNVRLICVGDIHGEYDKLKNFLKKVKELEEQEKFKLGNGVKIVFVGDYLDRGNESLEVVQEVNRLVKDGKAYAILGNHDEVFYSFIKQMVELGEESTQANVYKLVHYYDFVLTYQLEALDSFLKNTRYENKVKKLKEYYSNNIRTFYRELHGMCRYIYDNFKEELDFLKDCLLYLETDKYVISHSGGNRLKEVEDVTPDEWLWERCDFYPENNKVYIHGHTVTGSNKPTIKNNNINVDGGAIFYGTELVYYRTEPTTIVSKGLSHLKDIKTE